MRYKRKCGYKPSKVGSAALGKLRIKDLDAQVTQALKDKNNYKQTRWGKSLKTPGGSKECAAKPKPVDGGAPADGATGMV